MPKKVKKKVKKKVVRKTANKNINKNVNKVSVHISNPAPKRKRAYKKKTNAPLGGGSGLTGQSVYLHTSPLVDDRKPTTSANDNSDMHDMLKYMFQREDRLRPNISQTFHTSAPGLDNQQMANYDARQMAHVPIIQNPAEKRRDPLLLEYHPSDNDDDDDYNGKIEDEDKPKPKTRKGKKKKDIELGEDEQRNASGILERKCPYCHKYINAQGYASHLRGEQRNEERKSKK